MKKITESRKNLRVNKGIATQCRTYYVDDNLIEANPPIDLVMLNISEGGIGIVSRKEFRPGSVLIFNVDFGLESYKVMAKVIWTSEKEDGYASGLEFISIPYALKEALSMYENLV